MFMVNVNAVIDGSKANVDRYTAFKNVKSASRFNMSTLSAFINGYCGRGLAVKIGDGPQEPLHTVSVDDVNVKLFENAAAGQHVVSKVNVVGHRCRLDLEVVDVDVHEDFAHVVTVGDSLVVADPSCDRLDGSTLTIANVVPGNWHFSTSSVMTIDGVKPRELLFSATPRVPRVGWEPLGSIDVNDGLVAIFDQSSFAKVTDDHKTWYAKRILPNVDEHLFAYNDDQHLVVSESAFNDCAFQVYANFDRSSRVTAVKVDFLESGDDV